MAHSAWKSNGQRKIGTGGQSEVGGNTQSSASAMARFFLRMALQQLANACADTQQVLVVRLVQRALCTL